MTHWRAPEHLRLDPGDVIPDNWSTDEVLLVYDFLLRVITAIYDNYEDQMNPGLQNSDPVLGDESDDISSERVERSRLQLSLQQVHSVERKG